MGDFFRNKIEKYKAILWILLIPLVNIFYGVLNHGGPNTKSLVTDLDRVIPLIPLFIIPYMIWYPFVTGMLFVFIRENKSTYYRILTSIVIGLLACYAVYYVFQTTVPRPEVKDGGFLHSALQTVYANDEPFNCFPSIHVLTSYLIIKGASELTMRRFSHITVVFISYAIIISTLFVKQHVLLDLFAGIVLAEIVYLISKVIFPTVEHKPFSLKNVTVSSHFSNSKKRTKA